MRAYHRQPVGSRRTAVTVGRPGIAGRGRPGDPLCIRLLGQHSQRAGSGAAIRLLARSVTRIHYRRQTLIHCVCPRILHVRRVNIDDGGIASHRARPFQIQVRFSQLTLVDGHTTAVRYQNQRRVLTRKVEHRAELLQVRQVDGGLADHYQCLARAIDSLRQQRLDVIDGGEVVGRQDVAVSAGVIVRRRPPRLHPGVETEVIQSADVADHRLQRRGNGRLFRVREMQFAVHQVMVKLGSERAPHHPSRTVECDEVPASRCACHRETLTPQPRSRRRQIGIAQPVPRAIFFRREPLVILP